LYKFGRAELDKSLMCEAWKRADIRNDNQGRDADEFGPDVFRHEEVHSLQEAAYGRFDDFVIDYISAGSGLAGRFPGVNAHAAARPAVPPRAPRGRI
jgi:hypothetical protein